MKSTNFRRRLSHQLTAHATPEKLVTLGFEPLECRCLLAASPVLLADINTQVPIEGSSPRSLEAVRDTAHGAGTDVRVGGQPAANQDFIEFRVSVRALFRPYWIAQQLTPSFK